MAVSAVATLLALASQAPAAPPSRFTIPLDDTFPSEFLSDVCGIPVHLHLQGTVTVTVFYDGTGSQVVRELDILPGGLTVIRFSPADEPGGTGKSLTSVERAGSKFLYPNGANIGDPATIITSGLERNTGPGNPGSAGRTVFDAVIVDTTPEGIPVAEPVALASQTGRVADPDAFFQAICDALTGP